MTLRRRACPREGGGRTLPSVVYLDTVIPPVTYDLADPFTITEDDFRVLLGCGDGMVGGAEACDDGNTVAGDGCSSTCAVESGWDCTNTPGGDPESDCVEEPDTTPPEDEDKGKGCSTSGGAPSSSPLWILMSGLLFLLRRRRQHR